MFGAEESHGYVAGTHVRDKDAAVAAEDFGAAKRLKSLQDAIREVGGTLSGEHGIGNDKSAYMALVFGPDSMRLHWAVPAAFNPTHQLNPLKVFQNRRFAP